jgi:hypothetical protein
MGGFPNRPDLATFGPDVVNTGIVKDPSRQLSAEIFNLLKYQVAGLGLTAFRAMLRFTCAVSPVPSARAEVWNPRGLTSDPFGDPSITRIGAGEYNVVYPSPVLDQLEASVALSFTHGLGMVSMPSSTTLRHVTVNPLTGESAGMKVCVFNAAGTRVDGDTVVIFIG